MANITKRVLIDNHLGESLRVDVDTQGIARLVAVNDDGHVDYPVFNDRWLFYDCPYKFSRSFKQAAQALVSRHGKEVLSYA